MDEYWTAECIAKFLKFTPRYVKEHLAPHPEFPKAHRMKTAGGGRSHPRWKEATIREWAAACEVDVSCRRRARKND